jgi:hypothetical protein
MEKNGGCNQIISFCGFRFCWLCQRPQGICQRERDCQEKSSFSISLHFLDSLKIMDLIYYIQDFKRFQANTLVNLKRTIGSKTNAICSDVGFIQV